MKAWKWAAQKIVNICVFKITVAKILHFLPTKLVWGVFYSEVAIPQCHVINVLLDLPTHQLINALSRGFCSICYWNFFCWRTGKFLDNSFLSHGYSQKVVRLESCCQTFKHYSCHFDGQQRLLLDVELFYIWHFGNVASSQTRLFSKYRRSLLCILVMLIFRKWCRWF